MNLLCSKIWPNTFTLHDTRSLVVTSNRQTNERWKHNFKEKVERKEGTKFYVILWKWYFTISFYIYVFVVYY